MVLIVSGMVVRMAARFVRSGRCLRSFAAPCKRPRYYAGIGPGVFLLQLTPGIDCMIALLVGLLGGMLAGMALTRARMPDERTAPSTQLSRAPPVATPPADTPEPSEHASGDDPALTDEERIVRLLASNGGRMKQSQIVDSTDWSKAKVSRLLSAMDQGEEITKLTIGRENIIFLGTMEEASVSGTGLED